MIARHAHRAFRCRQFVAATTGRSGAGQPATAYGAKSGLLDKFAAKQLNLQWRQPISSGYSGPTVARWARVRHRSRG